MKNIFTIFLSLFLVGHVFAQKVNPNFFDGVLYFKLKASSQYSVSSNENGKVKLTDCKFLGKAITKYKITEITKPFYSSNDDALSRTYKLSFSKIYKIDKLIIHLQKITDIEYVEKAPINKIPSPTIKKLN